MSGSLTLAVASGKGGTGKTMLSIGLAMACDRQVTLADCDVEEPDCNLFLRIDPDYATDVTVPVPEIDPGACRRCGRCADFCRFNAIAALGDVPMVFPELCHGCGGCAQVCPGRAVGEVDRRVGGVSRGSRGGITLVEGRLEVGSHSAVPVIRAVRGLLPAGRVTVIDGPPGTSCAAVAAVRNTDAVLLVTEQTPFGQHDLGIAVETVRKLHLPLAVVVNRAGTGFCGVSDFCRREGIPVLAEIPEERRIAEAASRGIPLLDAVPGMRALFGEILQGMEEIAGR